MSNNRILSHPVLGKLNMDKLVVFTFDGEKYQGRDGEPIAAALLANGIRVLRKHEETSANRGIYCNIGHCFECRLTIDDQQGIRACLTPLRENMNIESGRTLENPVKEWSKKYG